jgi:hypothetical protein
MVVLCWLMTGCWCLPSSLAKAGQAIDTMAATIKPLGKVVQKTAVVTDQDYYLVNLVQEKMRYCLAVWVAYNPKVVQQKAIEAIAKAFRYYGARQFTLEDATTVVCTRICRGEFNKFL